MNLCFASEVADTISIRFPFKKHPQLCPSLISAFVSHEGAKVITANKHKTTENGVLNTIPFSFFPADYIPTLLSKNSLKQAFSLCWHSTHTKEKKGAEGK